MLRKVLREMVIFALLGMALAAVGVSIYLFHDQWQRRHPVKTITMFAPDGSTGEIPQDKVHDAVKAGGQIAIPMIAPDGSRGIVPENRVEGAITTGGMRVDVAQLQEIPKTDFQDPLTQYGGYIQPKVESLPAWAKVKPIAPALTPIAPMPLPPYEGGDILLGAGWASIFGFLGGIGIWAFYRLVRFAVKG